MTTTAKSDASERMKKAWEVRRARAAEAKAGKPSGARSEKKSAIQARLKKAWETRRANAGSKKGRGGPGSGRRPAAAKQLPAVQIGGQQVKQGFARQALVNYLRYVRFSKNVNDPAILNSDSFSRTESVLLDLFNIKPTDL